MGWLFAACVSALVYAATVTGTFVPLSRGDSTDYFFAAPPLQILLTYWALAVAVLALAFVTVERVARRQSPALHAEARTGRWLAPIAALAVVALGVLPAMPGIGQHGSVLAYFFYDLRWWWTIALAAATAVRVDPFVGSPVTRAMDAVRGWSSTIRLLVLDSMLFVLVVGWAVATTEIRFDNGLSGDEPKYVRYCEVWYQGDGLDISSLELVRREPVDAAPRLLGNARMLLGVPQMFSALAEDIQGFVRDPLGFRWNRASSEGGFVKGIHGGMYQIHEAGVCAVLFPGYFIDRYLLNVDANPDGRWPLNLTMTNVMMLFTYGICAVALFRLLRHALGSDILGVVWAAIAMMTFPTTAFAFQLYPEVPAMLLIILATNYVMFGNRDRASAAALVGVAVGSLLWLHVRFLLVCAVVALAAVFRTTGRTRVAFVTGWGVVVFAVAAFNYHVTGSWSPIARMQADGQAVEFESLGFVLNFIGYGLDRQLGLTPHAIVLIGAVPGLFAMAGGAGRQAFLVASIVVALVIPAAGYSLAPAGTTPGRFVTAIVPLLFWPVAVLVSRFWHSLSVRILTGLLVVASLDSALAYNWYHRKPFPALRDTSVSGWKPNLAFPIVRGEEWTLPGNLVLFAGIVAVVLGLSWLAFMRAGRRPLRSPGRPALQAVLVSVLVVVGLVGAFGVATSASSDWTHPLYLLDPNSAQAAAIDAVVGADRCFCFTSERGRVDWTTMGRNSARSAVVGLYPEDLDMTVHVIVEGDSQSPAFGRMRVEFGDGEETGWEGVVTERRIVHAYSRPGAYPVKVWFQVPTVVSPQLHQDVVTVTARD